MRTINIISLTALLSLGMSGCTEEDLNRLPEIKCENTVHDSKLVGDTVKMISSFAGSPVYHRIRGVRTTAEGNPVNIDYMVHPSVGTSRGIIVLIAGGKLNAGLTGVDGETPSSIGDGSATNFLVRSAYLYALNGFTVITLDRPSDHATDTDRLPEGFRYDGYRTSPRHAVDISSIVNEVNTSIPRQPVFIVGTSRGAISTVVHHKLSEAISISVPVTTGSGTPVSESSSNPMLRPGNVEVPAHVMWNKLDACEKSEPVNSLTLSTQFSPWAAIGNLTGGFDDPYKTNDCNANTVHGFLGIETCAVNHETNWLRNIATSLPADRPVVPAIATATPYLTPVNIPVYHRIAELNPTRYMDVELPFTATSLGGSISYYHGYITYTPSKDAIPGAKDTFAFIVKDSEGGRGHNVISVTIN